ncbi:hypothetical protein ACSFXN_18085 [Planococcus sp. 1R117A]|uniref:hypothetical protein n=1 Tax=Planococcus sp. 1R117A TaxID=3447020 RepID=UPI003EDBB85F
MSPITDYNPFIRWLDKEWILLVQRRNNMHDDNVFIIDLSGTVLDSFDVGDAIEGVVIGTEGIWISYYYEGFKETLPNEKLLLFNLKGKPVFRYESDLPEKPDIMEGMALVKGKGSAIWLANRWSRSFLNPRRTQFKRNHKH